MNYYVSEINSSESRIKDKIDILKRYGIDTNEFDNDLKNIISNASNTIEVNNEQISGAAIRLMNEAGYASTIKKLHELENELDNKQTYLKIHFKITSLINEAKSNRDFDDNKLKMYITECKKILGDVQNIKCDNLEESKRITLDIYRTMYEVIKLELIANGKSTLLSYMLKNKIGLEYINDLVREDIEYLEENDLYNADVDKHISRVIKEGFDYTYADEDLILSIAILLDDRIWSKLDSQKNEISKEYDEIKKVSEKNEELICSTDDKIRYYKITHGKRRAKAVIGAIVLSLSVLGYKIMPSVLKKADTEVLFRTTREAYDTVSEEIRTEETYGKKHDKEFTELKVYGPVGENGKRTVKKYRLTDLNLDDITEYPDAVEDDKGYLSKDTIDYRFSEQLSREEYSTVERMTYGEEKSVFDEESYNKDLIWMYRLCEALAGASSGLLLYALIETLHANRKKKSLEEVNEDREELSETYEEQLSRYKKLQEELENTVAYKDELTSEEYKKIILRKKSQS